MKFFLAAASLAATLAAFATYNSGAEEPSPIPLSSDIARAIGLTRAAFRPQRFRDLRFLLSNRDGRDCDAVVIQVLDQIETYEQGVLAGHGDATSVQSMIEGHLFYHGQERTWCFQDVFQAKVLASTFLMTPDNYDPSYVSFSHDKWRVPARLGPTFFVAYLLNKGLIQASPFLTLGDAKKSELCGREVLGAYFCEQRTIRLDPLLPPFDLGAAVIHEIAHLTMDASSFGAVPIPALLPTVSEKSLTPKARRHLLEVSLLAEETVATVTSIAAEHLLHHYKMIGNGSYTLKYFYQSIGDITLRSLGKDSIIHRYVANDLDCPSPDTAMEWFTRDMKRYFYRDLNDPIPPEPINPEVRRLEIGLIKRIAKTYFPTNRKVIDTEPFTRALERALDGLWGTQQSEVEYPEAEGLAGVLDPRGLGDGEVGHVVGEMIVDNNGHEIEDSQWDSIGAYDAHYLELIQRLKDGMAKDHPYCQSLVAEAAHSSLGGYLGNCSGSGEDDWTAGFSTSGPGHRGNGGVKGGNGGVKGGHAIRACVAIPEGL